MQMKLRGQNFYVFSGAVAGQFLARFQTEIIRLCSTILYLPETFNFQRNIWPIQFSTATTIVIPLHRNSLTNYFDRCTSSHLNCITSFLIECRSNQPFGYVRIVRQRVFLRNSIEPIQTKLNQLEPIQNNQIYTISG